jgi:hypothetical protein
MELSVNNIKDLLHNRDGLRFLNTLIDYRRIVHLGWRAVERLGWAKLIAIDGEELLILTNMVLMHTTLNVNKATCALIPNDCLLH